MNQVGGQDELVFDGGSFVVLPGTGIVARAPRFEAHELLVDVPAASAAPAPGTEVVALSAPPAAPRAALGAPRVAHSPDALEEVWSALVLGTADYVDKNGFDEVVVGLSGRGRLRRSSRRSPWTHSAPTASTGC